MGGLSRTLIIMYEACVNLVLSNLLIALMTTTYDKIAETSELEWYWQFADLVLQARALIA